MNKKQQIEEMARLSCGYLKNDICIVKLKECDIDCCIATTVEKIYNAGYRKIDDDCAVITKDDLNLYKKQAVKDTAKEILQYVGDLYDDCDERFHLKDYQWHKNLCKKYGV